MVATQSILSDRVMNLAESETLKMARMARELRAQGYDVISLSLGEPDFDTPDFIKEANEKGYRFPNLSGYAELKIHLLKVQQIKI